MRAVCVAIMACCLVSGCTQKASYRASEPAGDGIVATVGGETITRNDLDEAAKDQIQRIEMKMFQIRKRVLAGLIESKLVAEAAKGKGVSVEQFVAEEVEGKVTEPTEEEITAVYEVRKGRDSRTLEKMREQIVGYLKQNQRMRIRGDLIAKLKAEHGVKVLLEPPRVDIAIGDAPSMGPRRAPVTIVEFSDYECPFSKRVRETVWGILDTYKDKVRYVYRDFPLSFHRNAQKAHEAAHCAGDQGKYFEYNRLLFEDQKKLSKADLKAHAQALGLNMKKFDRCLEKGKHVDRVKKSIVSGTAAGVSGTPAFFINGVILSGAQPIAAFTEIIDSELEKK